ncbi:MAG: hypothetical protein AB1696_23465 [Planctomycetota bacterium]
MSDLAEHVDVEIATVNGSDPFAFQNSQSTAMVEGYVRMRGKSLAQGVSAGGRHITRFPGRFRALYGSARFSPFARLAARLFAQFMREAVPGYYWVREARRGGHIPKVDPFKETKAIFGDISREEAHDLLRG